MNLLAKRGILFLVLILTACATHSIDGDRHFAGIETAQSATVALFPMYLTGPVALNEETLRKGGCTFTTRDPVLIASLISELKSKVRTVDHPDGPWEQEPRELIYLTLANGEEVKFRFSAVFSNQADVRGVFVGTQTKSAVSADMSFPKAMYMWAVRVDDHPSRSGNHVDRNEVCSFVWHYYDYRNYMAR